MRTTDFTTVVAVDQRTISQFLQVWPLWKKFSPCLLDRPLLVVVDNAVTASGISSVSAEIDHLDCQRVFWDWRPDLSQRERMLSAFVKEVPQYVATKYWLKIDTDAFPVRPLGDWIDPKWFDGDPVLIANPWGYTKPGEWINTLEDWAKIPFELRWYPPLGLRCPPGVLRFGHPRVASWMCFARTDWSRKVALYCPDRLPVPSQDTFHWYCAARRGDLIRKVSFKRTGWTNVSSDRQRTKKIEELLK